MSPPTFERCSDRAPCDEADAPGRVNLIGEHTDYNGGFVLPAAIPQRTRVAGGRARRPHGPALERTVSAIRAFTPSSSARRSGRGSWVDYVKGMTRVLGPVRSAASMRASTRTCRSAAGCRRAPRSKSRRPRDSAQLFALADRRRRAGAGGPAGRERVRRGAGRDHGPDGVQPRRHHGRAVPRHPVAAARARAAPGRLPR